MSPSTKRWRRAGWSHFGLGLAEPEMAEGEICIAQPVAEGIKRLAVGIPVARGKGRGIFRGLSQIVIVIEWRLAAATGPAYREMRAGIRIAEKNIGDGVSAFLAGIPYYSGGKGLQDRGNALSGSRIFRRKYAAKRPRARYRKNHVPEIALGGGKFDANVGLAVASTAD